MSTQQATPLVFERVFQCTPARLWKAITDKDEMKEWYFDLEDFRAEPGFTFTFMGGPAHRTYLHLCEVIEAVPLKKLVYSWRYDGYEGVSYVTFEIFPEGAASRLKLTHSGLESFPPDNPDLEAKNFNEGWTSILDDNLRTYLGKD